MTYIQVEGLKEFQKAVRQARDKELDKRLGQANKQIGQLVIDRLRPGPDPRAVGAGKGATPRASASKREVVVRVGGGHRVPASGTDGLTKAQITKMSPWGTQRVGRVGVQRPDRPFVQGTAESELDAIGDAWLDATMAALRPAFA